MAADVCRRIPQCLRKVAAAIGAMAQRPTDLAVRFGGEEFVLLFASTAADAAWVLAETTRKNVEALALPHPLANCVTLSGGVATIYPSASLDSISLLTAADAALYRAKKGGRNRIERAPTELI